MREDIEDVVVQVDVNQPHVITRSVGHLPGAWAVKEGVELNRHYVHMMCTPTRASFQSARPSAPQHTHTHTHTPQSVATAAAPSPVQNGALVRNTPRAVACSGGRLPIHVLTRLSSPCDSNGAIPRNMTGIATKLSAAGYLTHSFGKWDAGMATPGAQTPFLAPFLN